MTQFNEMIREYQGRTQEEFCAKFLNPFLLVKTQDPNLVFDDPDDTSQEMKDTIKLDDPFGNMPEPWDDVAVYPLESPPGKGDVTVGRGSQNDIVFSVPQLSKIHVIFQKTPTGLWTVQDPWSTNGTTLNGENITRAKPQVIEDTAVIILAQSIQLTFFSPKGLHNYMSMFAT